MKNINSCRVFKRNDHDPNPGGKYVMYWMQAHHRFEYNYALDYAVGWANKLDLPLLVHEGIVCNYRWASDRFHQFLLESTREDNEISKDYGITYYPYLETFPGEADKLVSELAKGAAVIITDEYPTFIMAERNKSWPKQVNVPYITVDSNGIIPLGMTDKAPYSAYHFRKIMQRHFVDCFTNPPDENPLSKLKNTDKLDLPETITKEWRHAGDQLSDIDSFIAGLDVDHSIDPVEMKGTRVAALFQMNKFLENDLAKYGEERNDPDCNRTSHLSPWLHFGKISEYEIVKGALDRQTRGWDLSQVKDNNGQRSGFLKGHSYIEKFLDELITWREIGYHFCQHTPDYDKFESLPNWVLETFEEHKSDPREYVYSLQQFEQAQTHDEIWNAAQRQLVVEGYIHNYLRMLWGKKILEWTKTPEDALEIMIELNNKYAMDGRDPNSYSGIFWILGRFDRPWFERPIFGKIRYMSSDSTRKKVKLKKYLEKYGN
ncbi:MAG TPA: FAD-binding domain-containing protein [Balneolales bacterium]|nr:FAD-binding domain-containing protein [Balneolales bacterium]